MSVDDAQTYLGEPEVKTFQTKGHLELDRLPCEVAIAELVSEAESVHSLRQPLVREEYSYTADGVRGPRRNHASAPGPTLVKLHEYLAVSGFASDLLGQQAYATRAAYLYYDAGDFVGLHTDSAYCELTLIINVSGGRDSLFLYPHLYRHRNSDELISLSALIGEARDTTFAVPGPVRQGACLALLGRDLPHRRPPASDRMTVATLCYATL